MQKSVYAGRNSADRMPGGRDTNLLLDGDLYSMWNLDAGNIVAHWLVLTAVFLVLVYLFRGKVNIEGFWGFFILILVVIPLNVLPGATHYIDRLLESQPAFLASTQILANLLILLFWGKYLAGFSFSSIAHIALFAVFFGLLAFVLQFAPIIPFASLFERSSAML